MPNRVFERLASLAECLCAEIANTDGSPEPCFCGVIPGNAAIADYAGNCPDLNGMAWVRLVSAFPSVGISEQYIAPGNCGAELSLVVELGILRCLNPDVLPTTEDMLEAASLAADDALIMQRAIICCPGLNSKDYVLGSYNPTGPLGGIYGGTWQLTLVA